MGSTRKRKLICNLTFLALAAVVLWLYAGKPLPAEKAYRAAEEAYFMEEKEILFYLKAARATISKDADTVYIHTDRWSNPPGEFAVYPIENGVACGIVLEGITDVAHRETPYYVVAYEESGAAVRAVLELDTHSGPMMDEGITEDLVFHYRVEAQKESGLFVLPIALQEPMHGEGYATQTRYREQQVLSNIYWYEIDPERDKLTFVTKDYALKVSFYDAAGNVTAVLERGEDFPDEWLSTEAWG